MRRAPVWMIAAVLLAVAASPLTSSAVEPHQRGIMRWVWERVPPVENLSPGYRKAHLRTDRPVSVRRGTCTTGC